MSTEQWVVGKQVDQREVYIVVSTKNSNLIELEVNIYSGSIIHSFHPAQNTSHQSGLY